MHVRRLYMVAGAVCSLIFGSYAESETLNFFGGIGAGFGMGGKLNRSTVADNAAIDVKDRFFNYGSGLKLDIGSQYTLMENLALQASFGYSMGVPALEKDSGSAVVTEETTQGYHLFGVKIHIIPRFQVLDLLDMYTGVGVGVYWNASSFKIVRTTATNKQEAKGTIASSASLGFSGLLGANYPLSDKLTIFGELGFEQISFSLTKRRIKESTIPGVVGGTVQNYEKNAAGINNLPPEKIPGSNFQVRLGVRIAVL